MVFAGGTGATAPDVESVAALDLGSSSFRLLRGDWHEGCFRPRIDISRHVGLAGSVQPDGWLEGVGEARALAVLEEFRPFLADLDPHRVWAVGTASLRDLRDGEAFQHAVEDCLGFPLRIIDGAREAQLTYAGAVATRPSGDRGPFLVLDLGGASTELAGGSGAFPERTLSLSCGCATLAASGEGSLDNLCRQVRRQLPPDLSVFREAAPPTVLAAPGVIRTLAALAGTPGCLTVPGLEEVGRLLERGGGDSPLPLGAPDHHRRLLPGAWAILSVLAEELDLAELKEAEAGLREGMVRELAPAPAAFPRG
jgi:exopolyphosphatase/guanosine-5'-triphosphate,3'-diphosphate pyrophosphatase